MENNYPQRIFLEISYDGSNYFGWQRQPEFISIQQAIEEVLSKLYDEAVYVVGCGRTDTGVHAKRYFLHYDAPKHRDNLEFILQKMLPADIGILAVHKVKEDAHARFDAQKRCYWYFINETFDPFQRNTSYWYPQLKELNFENIQKACSLFKSYNNYISLCRFNPELSNHLSYVNQADWCYFKEEKRVIFKVSSNRFLRNQIRRMVGCLIDIGRGKISLEELEEALKEGKELKYQRTAPPQALFLWNIEYPYLQD
ncbi:MAG: tRNA pseudouridine(38-40) synthase TruA [Chitinophagales bacterium]|nr:tRNA pseudouridine(38-40) synthase TruA [Chitinophagales bacterium]